jgi:hypothetical protein
MGIGIVLKPLLAAVFVSPLFFACGETGFTGTPARLNEKENPTPTAPLVATPTAGPEQTDTVATVDITVKESFKQIRAEPANGTGDSKRDPDGCQKL